MDNNKWYSGKYDRAFKEVMLKESNRDLLTMLLEHILKVKINNITILNVEKLMTNVHIRAQRLDLNLDTNIGKINVEVNSTDENYIPNRNFAFLADIYSHDVLVGQNYDLNRLYIQINLSYGLNKDRDTIEIYKMINDKGRTYIDNFILYVINMDYYTNLFNTNDKKKIKSDIILVMLGQERDNLNILAKTNKVVSKYMDELDEVNKNPEFRIYMSKEEDDRKIRNTLIKEAAENGFNKGINQIIDSLLESGMSKEEIEKRININPEFREYMSYELEQEIFRNTEHKLGFEQGIKQGIEQGIEQRNSEIVNNLLNTNMSISEISKIVNLPEEDIIKIKDAK